MKLFVKGRPYTDFEDDVLNLKQAGAKVGHMNHSRKFPAAFRPCVYGVVKTSLKSFLTKKLPQTAMALSADKATYKHCSRQFIGGVTISHGTQNFLEIVSFGQPIVKEGSDGLALCKKMKNGLDDFNIAACQIESAVLDGVYFHCNVQKHINALYGLGDGDNLYSYDTLHKSGLVDTHMCKKKEFSWVVEITQICHQGPVVQKLVSLTLS